MMRTRLLFFLSLLITAVTGVWAQQVSPEQAKEIASQFLKGQSTKQGGRRSAPTANTLKTNVVFNAKDVAGQPYLYAVSATQHDGFVLVSGDERFPQVLGYTDDGTFDEQNIPENMRDFLQGYIDEMKYLLSINYQPSESARRAAPAAFATIAPMLTSTWNQDNPYNMYCPQYDNYGNNCPTGCLATALAQVMCYHGNYKKTGQSTTTLNAIPAYTTSTMQYNIAEKPTRTFDWTLMTGAVPTTDAAKQEVAHLMEYIGAGVQMNYRKDGSGAALNAIPSLLADVFGYDHAVREVLRNDYSISEWLNMMYKELSTNGPVMYGGQATNGGHGFVLDGYKYENGEHLFHINWGWGGWSDGYFLLSLCNPAEQGIGGTTSQSGFNRAQSAIIDMNPNDQGTAAGNNYRLTAHDVALKGNSVERFKDGGLHNNYFIMRTDWIKFTAANFLPETHHFNTGIGLVNSLDEMTVVCDYKDWRDIVPGTGVINAADILIPDTVPNGEYKLIAICQEGGNTRWMRDFKSNNLYVKATISGDLLTLKEVRNSVNLTGSITHPAESTVGEQVTVVASVTNNGNLYSGDMMLTLTELGGSPVIVDQKQVEIASGTNATFEFYFTPTKTGKFSLNLRDMNYNIIGVESSIVVKEPIITYTVKNSQGKDIKYQKDGNQAIVIEGGAYNGNVIIPDHVTLDGEYCTVTEIGSQAFRNTNLTEITIPGTVTKINTNAFSGSMLRTVTFDGTSTLLRIEASGFSNLNNLTAITIPASVTYIGNTAFYGCVKLASVTVMGTTPASMGFSVFGGNASGRKIYVPDGQVAAYQTAAEWSYYASDIMSQMSVGGKFDEGDFSYQITNVTEGSKAVTLTSCTASGAVEIPSSVKGFTVTAIGAEAFKNNNGVTSVVIPATVTAIGDNAFDNSCTSLTSVTLWPAIVPTLANGTFNHDSVIIYVYGDQVNDYYNALSLYLSQIKPIQFTETNRADIAINYDLMSATEARVSRNADATGALEIPATVYHKGANYSVTTIADGAFQNCTGLTSVILPESITRIGANAFNGCSALNSVTILSASIPTLDNENAFGGNAADRKFYVWGDLRDNYYLRWGISSSAYIALTYTTGGIKYELANVTSAKVTSNTPAYSGDVVIPATITYQGLTLNVTGISNNAFKDCTGLTAVSIPEGVTAIGSYAFNGCSGLTEVLIPNSVTSVGNLAFLSCSNLAEVSLGSGVTYIGEGAFYSCSSLKKVWIYSTDVPTLNNSNAFGGNDAERKIYVPDGRASSYKAATNWSTYADYIFNMSAANSFTDGEFDFVITNNKVGERTVAVTGVHTIYQPMEIPSTAVNDGTTYAVTSIAAEAFMGREVSYVVIPTSVTSIGDRAFYGCVYVHPEYGSYATLSTVEMKSSTPPVLGNEVFDGHGDDFNIHVNLGSIATYQNSGNWAVYGSDITALWSNNIVDGIYYSFNNGQISVIGAPYENPYTGDIVIPSEISGFPVVAINGDAFRTSETGYEWQWKKCLATSVTIPSSVKSIGSDAFRGCTTLTSVTIPNGVTTISDNAFSGCENLTSVTIPSSVQSIGSAAFNYCSNLVSITVMADTPPTLTKTIVSETETYDVFDSNKAGRKIYVPSTSETTYEAADGWSKYSSDIDPMDTFAEGGINYAITDNTNKTVKVAASTYVGDLVIPQVVNDFTVTAIDANAFKDCATLTSVSIPSTVTTIGVSAFTGCSNLSTVIINSATKAKLGDVGGFSGNATGRKIFVESSLLESYRDYGTAWYNYASDILPFVDYEEGSWNGGGYEVGFTTHQLKSYTQVTDDITTFENGKWYVITNDVNNENRITVQGTAHLVLCDGVTLTLNAGLGVTGGKTLNIYGQSAGTGRLDAASSSRYAAIGGNSDDSSCGIVNIHGGYVYCHTSGYGAGIGGGQGGNGGAVTVFGGILETHSSASTGIGMGAGGTDNGTLSVGSDMIVLGGNDANPTLQQGRPYNSRFNYMTVTPALILDENIDNSEAIAQASGKTMAVSMERTLKAGGWNSFCVPCNLSSDKIASVFGSDAQVKKLDSSSFANGELTLTFTNAPTIEAGKPYLVKVSNDIINPFFSGVTVNREVTNVETESVDFMPVMMPTKLQEGDKSILFVIGGNSLTWPAKTSNLNGFRAIFKLHENLVLSARSFVLDFGEDTQSIKGILITEDDMTTSDVWYTLDGRKLQGKPIQKGMYISHGRKVVVK